MIPFFVGYAVLMWFLTYQGRRQLAGWTAFGIGLTGLILIAIGHVYFSYWAGIASGIAISQIILYPYIFMVSTIALYLACAPRVRQAKHGQCSACGYDVSSLMGVSRVCPECAEPIKLINSHGMTVAQYQRQKWGGAAPVKPIGNTTPGAFIEELPKDHFEDRAVVLPKDQPVQSSQQQNQHRQARDQAPAQPAEC